jgi:hypothetical protein
MVLDFIFSEDNQTTGGQVVIIKDYYMLTRVHDQERTKERRGLRITEV